MGPLVRRAVAGAVLAVSAVLAAGAMLAPSALADSVANFRDAVASLRDGTSCGPLRYNPVVEQVAETINRSTDQYIDHDATQVPIIDPLPGLNELGYGSNKAKLLSGAGRTDADAIKGALLEGYSALPDCSYTDFGVSVRRNETSGYVLTSLVLAGA